MHQVPTPSCEQEDQATMASARDTGGTGALRPPRSSRQSASPRSSPPPRERNMAAVYGEVGMGSARSRTTFRAEASVSVPLPAPPAATAVDARTRLSVAPHSLVSSRVDDIFLGETKMPRRALHKNIEAATVEFKRLFQELKGAFDARVAAGEESEDAFFDADIEVVIQQHVTVAMFQRVPHDWLRGLRVILRGSGDLVLIGLTDSPDHNDLVITMQGFFRQYADQILANTHSGEAIAYENGGVTIPDGVVFRPGPNREPILAFEVEVTHRSIPKMIQHVSTMFANNGSLECVVCVRAFDVSARSLARGQFRRPMLVVAFERDQTSPIGIRVIAESGFGNARLHGSVNTNMSVVPSQVQGAPRVGLIIRESPHLNREINIATAMADLVALRALVPHILQVPIAGRPALEINLTVAFWRQASDWINLHTVATVAPAAAVPPAAVAPAQRMQTRAASSRAVATAAAAAAGAAAAGVSPPSPASTP